MSGAALLLNRPLGRIHVEHHRFVDEDGQEWIWRGATNFLLFQRFLEGEDIEPLLYPGAEVYRVTLVMKFIPNLVGLRDLRPENYAHYWPGLDAFAEYLLVRRKRLEATCWCDIQMMGQDRRWLQRHLDQANEILNARPNAFGELVNEYPKNGVNPLDFQRPHGAMLWSRGSGLVDAPPARPGWDWFGFHGRRDWPKVTSSTEDMWAIANSVKDGWNSHLYPPMIAIHGEGIGFSEVAIANKRSTSKRLARLLGVASRELGSGGDCHLDAGVMSLPLGPIQQDCLAEFSQALM